MVPVQLITLGRKTWGNILVISFAKVIDIVQQDIWSNLILGLGWFRSVTEKIMRTHITHIAVSFVQLFNKMISIWYKFCSAIVQTLIYKKEESHSGYTPMCTALWQWKRAQRCNSSGSDSAEITMCLLVWQRCQLPLLLQWCAHR